jgi:hypothetical protein
MFKQTKTSYYATGAMFTMGMLAAGDAHANNFGSIAQNITNSVASIPGLLSALAYLFGILLGVLGIMKIKDHVENPSQTPLKDGAIRLAAGGALFALPIIFEAMFETVGSGSAVQSAKVKTVVFNVD